MDQTSLFILERFLERQEATGIPFGDGDEGGSHFWRPVLLQGYQCWQVPFWSPPFRLLALRDDLLTRELATVMGPIWAIHPASLGPIILQRGLVLAPFTRGPTASLTRTYIVYQLAEAWDPWTFQPAAPGPSSVHQWASSHHMRQHLAVNQAM